MSMVPADERPVRERDRAAERVRDAPRGERLMEVDQAFCERHASRV